MALSRVKTWVSGEVLLASDLNSEFNNILNNALTLISPLTTSLNAGGFKITSYGTTDVPSARSDVPSLGQIYDSFVANVNTVADLRTLTGAVYANAVFEGDSLTAGGTLPAGQDYPTYLMTLSKFSGVGTKYNVAVGGSKLEDLITRYTANVYPKRPAGSVTKVYLFILIGTNNYHLIGTGGGNYASSTTFLAALEGYWAQAKADGFTVIAMTIPTDGNAGGGADTQETIRKAINWGIIRSRTPDYIYNLDARLPSNLDTIMYQVDQVHPTYVGNQFIALDLNNMFAAGGSFPFDRVPVVGPLTPNTGLVTDSNGSITTALSPISYIAGVAQLTLGGGSITVDANCILSTPSASTFQVAISAGSKLFKWDAGGIGTGQRFFSGGDLTVVANGGKTLYLGGNGTVALTMDTTGGIVPGSGALATNATTGFTYMETCAGTPTGTPTAYTGRAGFIYDTTNNFFYVNNPGVGWKKVAMA